MTRSRTPSALKLLLNERAAAEGELHVATRAFNLARANFAKAEADFRAARLTLAEAEASRERTKAVVDAQELTMTSMSPDVDPNSAGMVRSWAGKYGKRGAFTKFVLDKIRAAAPESVTTSKVVDAASAKLGLPSATLKERAHVRDSVRKRIWDAAAVGLVERVETAKGTAGRWRWKESSPGQELLLAAAAASERAHDVEPDTLGGEVGGQRAGCGHG